MGDSSDGPGLSRTLEQIIGGVYSALSVDQLPTLDQRPLFAERIRQALEPHAPFIEHVRVAMLMGKTE